MVDGDSTGPGVAPWARAARTQRLLAARKALDFCGTLYRLTSMKEPRLSAQTLKVLGALLSSPRDELSGAEIGRQTKIASGTLYPILLRLEEAGWFESRWETDDPRELGRPRRRFYRITALGAKHARKAMRELRPIFGKLAWES